GWIALRQSRYLLFMLGMIATIQVVITLVDYQFNAMVEQAYPDTDARTAAFGYVYAAIDSSALGLQLLTGPILVSIGVRGTLLGIPVIIGGTLLAFAISPVFLTMAVAKVAGKCFDYSIFRAAKEILYIPLNFAEKTQGKALVDIMTYRVAKGAASFLLMGLGALGLLALLPVLSLVLVGVWFALTVGVTRLNRTLTENASEQVGGE
ncbi:MAG: AAA family ATP:ADP antiporter, partial [Myxococcota bacterium]